MDSMQPAVQDTRAGPPVTPELGHTGHPAEYSRESMLLTLDVGTLLWTAPELLRRGPYDGLVDVYR